MEGEQINPYKWFISVGIPAGVSKVYVFFSVDTSIHHRKLYSQLVHFLFWLIFEHLQWWIMVNHHLRYLHLPLSSGRHTFKQTPPSNQPTHREAHPPSPRLLVRLQSLPLGRPKRLLATEIAGKKQQPRNSRCTMKKIPEFPRGLWKSPFCGSNLAFMGSKA